MAEEKRRYTRKLSGEEIRGRFIMVLKNDLDFFPKIGTVFKLKINGKDYDARLDAIECWCRGPRKPHFHYQIKFDAFRDAFKFHYAKLITLEKLDEKQYELK